MTGRTTPPGGVAIAWNRASGRDQLAQDAALVPGLREAVAAYGKLAPLRFFAEFGRSYAERDVDAVVALFAESWAMRDFRPHEPEAIRGVEGARSMILSVFAVSPNLGFAIDRVLACDDRVIALTVSYRGRARGGRGEFVYLTGYVAEIEDGRWLSTSEFEPDEDVAMLARYRELSGH